MANWKKVIVSGSNAELGQVTASGGFFGDGSGLTNVQASSLNIEGFTDGTAITVLGSDKVLLSDGGVEKYINVSQLFDSADFDSEVAGNSAVKANTDKVSADGSVTDHSDIDDAGSGAIITSGERDKLTNIEEGADVTDAANVRGAGALMDDEVTNLTQVKAFDKADYATAAQGTTADSALQDITGESVTDLTDVTSAGSGAIITSVERTKLTNIEANADVTDTVNVTAAGALMDSEVTNLTAVKSFDPADYATATQGATADAALPASDVSAFGASLIDDASASAARKTLGLGSIATLNSIDISANTNLAVGTGVTLTGDTLSIGQEVGTSNNVQFRNITATGDLIVNGEITSVNTANLNVEDSMILLNSGSVDARDAGFVFGGAAGTANSGDAFFYDSEARRPAWSQNVAWDAVDVLATAFIPRVFEVDLGHTPVDEVGSTKIEGGEIYMYV